MLDDETKLAKSDSGPRRLRKEELIFEVHPE